MRQGRSTLRAGSLIASSALALHELRYLIGYGDGSASAVAEQGHTYLPAAGAIVALLLALAIAQLARALAGDRREPRRPLPFLLVWALASVALLAVYCGQELTEGALSAGHPSGLAALAAHGGIVAVPLAAAFGLLVAVVLRGARAAIAAAARRRAAPRARTRVVMAAPGPAPALALASVIGRNLAGRAPPSA